MSGKGDSHKKKREIFKKAHPEGRTVFALKRNIEKHKTKLLSNPLLKNIGLTIKAMEDRLSRIAPNQ